ncbi:hypothetical protein DFR50_1229 [Roseiarcus fermentans]|uniref:Uncharacterized protein n=1 Tax=Roseiarcus fermentans TaxID=1473586 RepID=A0A366F3D7_9HYPH|nr:hypothetical protein [Roseiarcus fermentans]RBP09172.1 hypothetical protein DFR50_1229 [Roseiarcus fermentans]
MTAPDASAAADKDIRDEGGDRSPAPTEGTETTPAAAGRASAEGPGPDGRPTAGETSVSQAESPGAAPADALADARAALDRRDYATARRLFAARGRTDATNAIDAALAALDRKDYAAAREMFGALASIRSAAPPDPAGPAGEAERTPPSPPAVVGPLDALASIGPPAPPNRADPSGEAERAPPSPPAVIVPLDPDLHRPAPRAKRRRLSPLVAGLALLALCGVALAVSQRAGMLGALRAGALADLAAPAGAPPAKPAAAAEGEGAALHDLRAALADATARLDGLERETRARLDSLAERIDRSGAPTVVAARLDALEKAAPPSAGVADLAARLDRLEKKAAAVPPAPASDLAARLDKLEKKVAVAAAMKPAPAKPAVAAVASDPGPGARRLLPDYEVEDVQNGVAVVASRYGGPQQVTPGDVIPGAGRVLGIERRGGAWVVVTSNGVIASAPAPY